MMRVGINGLGRIGRAILRINAQRKVFQVAAINDIDPSVENHIYLLRYDSIYGAYCGEISGSSRNNRIVIEGNEIEVYCKKQINNVPWGKHDIDVVIDSSGLYENVVNSHKLVGSGEIKKVIVTHSPKNYADTTIIFGVNENKYNCAKHHVISTSICDANAAGPVLRILDNHFGIRSGFITTLHPWLSYQNLLDGSMRSASSPTHFWQDFSLGRASTGSLIPKDTTLVKALARVMPQVAKNLKGMSFRVPTAVVAASDMVLCLKKRTTRSEVDSLFRNLAKENSRVFGYTKEPLVSIDFKGIGESVVVDARWIEVNGGHSTKMVLWYDNEWGYSQRVIDMAALIAKNIQGHST